MVWHHLGKTAKEKAKQRKSVIHCKAVVGNGGAVS